MKPSTFRNLLMAGALFTAAHHASALTINASGSFTKDNDYAALEFEIPVASEVTLKTTSYAQGGFDPILSLFGPSTVQGGAKSWTRDASNSPIFNDDGPDPLDSFIQVVLAPGFYAAIVTQAINLIAQEPVPPYDVTMTDNFFTKDLYGSGSSSNSTSTCTQFCNFEGDSRTGFWSLDITAVPVTEPETFALMAIGLAGLGYGRRRTH